MDPREFQGNLIALLTGAMCDDEIEDFLDSIRYAESYEDAALLTGNMGIVVKLKTGEEYQLTMCGCYR